MKLMIGIIRRCAYKTQTFPLEIQDFFKILMAPSTSAKVHVINHFILWNGVRRRQFIFDLIGNLESGDRAFVTEFNQSMAQLSTPGFDYTMFLRSDQNDALNELIALVPSGIPKPKQVRIDETSQVARLPKFVRNCFAHGKKWNAGQIFGDIVRTFPFVYPWMFASLRDMGVLPLYYSSSTLITDWVVAKMGHPLASDIGVTDYITNEVERTEKLFGTCLVEGVEGVTGVLESSDCRLVIVPMKSKVTCLHILEVAAMKMVPWVFYKDVEYAKLTKLDLDICCVRCQDMGEYKPKQKHDASFGIILDNCFGSWR